MRSKEFLSSSLLKLEFTETNGLDPLDWIILTECHLQGKTLVESLDGNSMEYLKNLTHYSATPTVGKKYIPILVMLMTEPDNRISLQGESSPAMLVDIKQEGNLTIYEFINNAGERRPYPESRLSSLSFFQLYVFETAEQFNMFASGLASKFKVEIPRVEFNES